MKKCSNPECNVPDGACAEYMDDYSDSCQYYLDGEDIEIELNEVPKLEEKAVDNNLTDNLYRPNWSGNVFDINEISIVGERSNPLIIGLIGTQDAGKTSFLGMLYLLLSDGYKIGEYDFAGSYTLVDWDKQAQTLYFNCEGGIEYPSPTPRNPDFYSFYHLALRRERRLQDILFVDIAGEGFKEWATNRDKEDVENVRWVHQNSNAFIFFIDCDALALKRGMAKKTVSDILFRLSENLNKRKVIVVWSKSDKLEKVLPNIKAKIKEDLNEHLNGNFIELEITNHPIDTKDERCFKNNLAVLSNILETMNNPSLIKFEIENIPFEGDFFLQYK